MQTNKNTISNLLILLSLVGTIILYIFPKVSVFGLNNYYLSQGNIVFFIIQIFSSSFLHGGFLHFFFNSIFIYYFGNIIEIILGRKKFLLFFIFTLVFEAIFIVALSSIGTTVIGISGFCMALVSFYTLELKDKNNPEWKGGVTALILNIAIGFTPGISLLGHVFGAIAGIIFYYLHKNWFKKRMIGLTTKNPT